jgi:HK97 family phage portal protein
MGLRQFLVSGRLNTLEARADLNPDNEYPDIDDQLYRRQRELKGSRPRVTVKEALGVPAVYRAVTLLSTTAASLQLKEYVERAEVEPASVVRRPARQWTPGAFTRDTVFHMATRGEAIWLVRERDYQGFASNLLPVAPEAIKSDWDGVEHDWYRFDKNGKRINYRREDVVHIPLVRDPDTGRGLGPMQVCGVALNVAVEADMWASRFFVGAIPSIFLESKVPLSGDDPAYIKQKWLTDPPNVPKVGYNLTPHMLDLNPEAAQLLGTQKNARGSVALMFGIPGRLLEYSEPGASLTYANVGGLATELVRLTLAPVYLEQIEQAFSDLRPRGHELRYDVEGLERADPKTRMEIHKSAIEAGIYTPEYAAHQEGIGGGSPEVIPAPLREVG